jgi:uncharacterized protein (TIRG00374 family)
VLGIFSWGITSCILIYILYSLGLIDHFNAELISVYPISMLAGALTFIPGGVGATEITMVSILNHFKIDMTNAFLAAILARFSTIWLATIIGLFCSWILSFKNKRISDF